MKRFPNGIHGQAFYQQKASDDTPKFGRVVQIVAERVVREHPKEATVKRFVKQRGEAMVYVDYPQNIKGKIVASAYCVRARDGNEKEKLAARTFGREQAKREMKLPLPLDYAPTAAKHVGGKTQYS